MLFATKNKITKFVSIGLLIAITFTLTSCGSKSPSKKNKVLPAQVVEKEHRRTVDFEKLREENSDISAWIELPGTVIDYPIMYSGDNDFYLTHNEKKEKDKNGAVFMDMGNLFEFKDPIIVTYGHYTPQDTYYSQLHLYEDKKYFDDNRELYVYLPGAQLNYEIVAAFLADDKSVLYGNNYQTIEDRKAFVDWINKTQDPDANIDMASANEYDQYLVLSTCTQAELRDKFRYVVIARLIEEI